MNFEILPYGEQRVSVGPGVARSEEGGIQCAGCAARLQRPIVVIPSRCAGRHRQRLTLPAVERPGASSEVDPASEVLECCVGITGGWARRAARGKSALNLSLWHTWTDTDRRCATDGLQRWPEHQRQTWWMKGLDENKWGNLFTHLTQFSASDAETILQYVFSI